MIPISVKIKIHWLWGPLGDVASLAGIGTMNPVAIGAGAMSLVNKATSMADLKNSIPSNLLFRLC